jgi:hypothetical protein
MKGVILNVRGFSIEHLGRTALNRFSFDVSLQLEERDRLDIRACSLVKGRTGDFVFYPPSRWNGEWRQLVGMPGWLRDAVREAALREVEQLQAEVAQ